MTPTAKSLSEQLRAMDWQTIKTAPKDGTIVLGKEKDVKHPQPMFWRQYSAWEAEESGQSGYWEYAESLIADFNGAAEPILWAMLPPTLGESSFLSSAASALEDAERERDRLQQFVRDNGTPRFNAVCARAEAAEAKLAEAIKVMKRLATASTSVGQHLVYNAPTIEFAGAITDADRFLSSMNGEAA